MVAPSFDRPLPATGRLDRELALPADAVDVGVDRVERRLDPPLGARRLVAHDRAQLLVAVAEDVGGDADGVADAALDRVASAVHLRGGVVDLDPRRELGSLRRGHSVRQPIRDRVLTNLQRSSGVQLHPTSLPSGRLGRDAYAFVDWLAEAGQSWWQMLPLGPPDRYGSPYKSASAFAAWPGLLAEPRAPVSKPEELDFRERQRRSE